MHAAVSEWPWFEQRSLGLQIVRAADSIGANIAEAMGRWHRPDQRRFLFVARGSLRELEHWVEVAQERGLLDSQAGNQLPELARTLAGLIRVRS
jgi:four helix bundle protein